MEKRESSESSMQDHEAEPNSGAKSNVSAETQPALESG